MLMQSLGGRRNLAAFLRFDMHPKSWTQQKGAFFMEKDVKTVFEYEAEFKKCVILDMLDNGLSIHEVVRKYWHVTAKRDIDKYRSTVRAWKRIYAEKGENGLMRNTISKRSVETILAPHPDKQKDSDLEKLLAENEYLRMENAYLKKLRALILEEERQKLSKHK